MNLSVDTRSTIANDLHFYVIGRKETFECKKASYKIGYHKGNRAKLIKRYSTSIPDLCIIHFNPFPRAKECEKMLLVLLDHCRLKNSNQNKSEWIQCPKERLLKYIRHFEEILTEVEDLGPRMEEVTRKKRKRDESFACEKIDQNPVRSSALVDTQNEEDRKSQNLCLHEAFEKKLKEMEQKDSLCEEYLYSVQCLMTSQERNEINEEVLRHFVQILTQRYSDPFPIPMSWVTKWLGYERERYLKDLFFQRGRIQKSANYTKKKDYDELRFRTQKNQVKIEIMLSISCFKDLCQRSNTSKARTIRKYFEKVESIYRNGIQGTLLKSLNLHVESSQKM